MAVGVAEYVVTVPWRGPGLPPIWRCDVCLCWYVGIVPEPTTFYFAGLPTCAHVDAVELRWDRRIVWGTAPGKEVANVDVSRFPAASHV